MRFHWRPYALTIKSGEPSPSRSHEVTPYAGRLFVPFAKPVESVWRPDELVTVVNEPSPLPW